MNTKKLYEKDGRRIHLDPIQADAFNRFGWKEVITPSEIAEVVAETVTSESAFSEESVSDLKLEEMTKEELLAEVIEITEDEYNTLKDAIDSGEEIVPETPEVLIEPEVPETPDENTGITLEFVKQKKIAEMSKACESSIVSGADVTLTDGNTYHFSFTEHDQSRIGLLASSARMAAMLEQMGMPTGETAQSYPWNPDCGDCVYYSRDDMILIGTAYEATVTYHKSYFHTLRDYINAMDDIQIVSSVVYGIDVPEEYWGVVYKDIMNGMNG